MAWRVAEAQLLCQGGATRRIARRGERVIGRQFPTGAIVRSFKPVFDAQMTAQHLASKPALETDDMVAVH